MVLWILFGLILVAGLFPQTPIARLFRTALFGDPDRPDAGLQFAKFGQAILIVLVLMAMGPAMPADIALIFAGDLALYLELTVAVMLAGVVGRMKDVLGALAVFASRCMARVSVVVRALARHAPRQQGKPRRSRPPRSDDAGPGWVFA